MQNFKIVLKFHIHFTFLLLFQLWIQLSISYKKIQFLKLKIEAFNIKILLKMIRSLEKIIDNFS